jgi:PDZ domain-containing protein
MIARANRVRFSAPPRIFLILFSAVITLALIAPMNYVLISPGTPTPLFPKLITLKDQRSFATEGQMYLLTVMITNPDTHVQGVAIARCWVRGDCVTVPRSIYYAPDTNDKKERSAATQEMKSSQDLAMDAARSAMKANFPDVDISNLKNSDLVVSLKNTGGPSGGLIFSLGIVELLTPEDLLQGRKIAGTGTITSDGHVGPIGGLNEKIIGARNVGAKILFISKANCADLPKKVEGIQVVAISTLSEAIAYLQSAPESGTTFNSTEFHGCASVGA